MKNRGWMILPLGLLIAACCSCASETYTRYNLHYVVQRGANKASYTNWTNWPGHGFLPYNSPVLAFASRNRIRFVTATGQTIMMEYSAAHMRMPANAYVRLITSPTPVTYDNLSDVDRQGVQAGKALVGMSKEGVEIALGYPAVHKTPSLADNRWMYWKGRFSSYVVEFDDSGKVVRVSD